MEKDSLPVENQNIEIKPLDESYKEIVKQHYTVKSLATDAYVLSRLQEGMLGAFLNDELVGYIGVHASGPMGMLEVFENFRGQRIGISLQAALMNQLLLRGDKAIFAQVNIENKVSDHMQTKLGLKRAEKQCYWFVEK